MAVLGEILDMDTTEPARDGFIDVPPGEYVMQIVHNDVVDNKAGTGKLLKLRWQVCDDTNEFNNQCVFQQINYRHASAEAQRIGRGQLKNITDALGFTGQLENGDVLMNQPLMVTIGWGKAKDGYDAKPEVKKVRPYGTAVTLAKPAQAPKPATAPRQTAAARPVQVPAARPAATPPGANSRPWANKPAA